MSMIDPSDPPEVQVAKQAKIIDALMRRADRQKDVGPSAFQAFRSAIELQQQIAVTNADLERAETELESARFERERTRQALVQALSSMDEGFTLFTDNQLDLYNDLFCNLLPDISAKMVAGLHLNQFFKIVHNSAEVVSADPPLSTIVNAVQQNADGAAAASAVIELSEDRWFQLSAQHTSPENIVVLMTDITAIVRRNRVEKETLIDRQADYLKAVFQNSSSGICTFSAKGEMMMLNAQFGEILGVPDSVLVPGFSLTGLIAYMSSEGLLQQSDTDLSQKWREALNTYGALHQRIGHGADRVVDIHANKLPDGGFLVELKDVTLEARTTETLENRVAARTAELTRANEQLVREYDEKARVEEELRVAKERAEAAVSSKTRFLAAASHDLLQPINAAKLLISTLQEMTRETDYSPMVERLEGAFGSAEQLLHSLLDISRLESADPDTVTPTDVSLGAIMEGVFADQALLAEQKNVKLDIVSCSVFVRSDPIYLLRSIQNLVVNAIQYTNPGGRVLVGCRRRGPHVVLEVWDTGIGIARADQTRIFEEFTRAANVPVSSGVGLGLSVVDRACRLLNHKLSLRSKPGAGTMLSIEMEVVEVDSPDPEPSALMLPRYAQGLDYIILVIENDHDVLYGTTQWLEQWGASVLAARNSAEAMAFVRDIGIAPDIILADYELDDGDTGIAAIGRIRDVTDTHVPAILITADRSEGLRRKGLENDVSVVTKPVKLSRLHPLIPWKVQQGTQNGVSHKWHGPQI